MRLSGSATSDASTTPSVRKLSTKPASSRRPNVAGRHPAETKTSDAFRSILIFHDCQQACASRCGLDISPMPAIRELSGVQFFESVG